MTKRDDKPEGLKTRTASTVEIAKDWRWSMGTGVVDE